MEERAKFGSSVFQRQSPQGPDYQSLGGKREGESTRLGKNTVDPRGHVSLSRPLGRRRDDAEETGVLTACCRGDREAGRVLRTGSEEGDD